MSKGLGDALKDAAGKAFSAGQSLAENMLAKLFSQETFMAIVKKMLPEMLEFIPIDCLQSICEASRKVQGQSPIKNMSDRICNYTDTAGFMIKQLR